MHHFFVPPEWIVGEQIIFRDDVCRQMSNVLRVRAGEKVVALDNLGNEFLVEIEGGQQELKGKILDKKKNEAESPVHLTLLFALAQREKVEWILQKGTEIGISRFIPLATERSLVRETSSAESKMERWKTILKEAAEQSGRGLIPQLEKTVTYSKGLVRIDQLDLGLIAWVQEKDNGWEGTLGKKDVRRIGVMIGPEGGFTDDEYQQAVERGWKSISLGRRVLRMETAALVAGALIINYFEK